MILGIFVSIRRKISAEFDDLARGITCPYHTHTTNNLNIVFPVSVNKFIWGAIFHGLPVYIGALLLFLICHDQTLTYDWTLIGYLALGLLWAGIGPPLIWWHETLVCERMLTRLRTVLVRPGDFDVLRATVQQKLNTMKLFYPLLILWMTIIMAIVFFSWDFIANFGLKDPISPSWVQNAYIKTWLGDSPLVKTVILFGAGGFAYYTGIVALLGYRELLFFRKLASIPLKINPYHVDLAGGWAFLGTFVANTSSVVAAALLMVPLFSVWGTHDPKYKPLAIVAPYVFYITFIFIYPVIRVHWKLMLEKQALTVGLVNEIEKYFPTSGEVKNNELSDNFNLRRDFLVDVQRVADWPLDIINISKPLIPPVASILAVLLSYYLK